MTAETELINAALALIGPTRITSLADGTTAAGAASALYAPLRDRLLAAREWKFATVRKKLALLEADPVYEFENAFAIPDDWLRTVAVHHNEAGVGHFLYRMETLDGQRVILASVEDVWMRYIWRVTDTTLWSADFYRAFMLQLAADLAIPVASSNAMAERYARLAASALGESGSADSMNSFPQRRPRGSWATSRGGRWPTNWPT